MSPAHLPWLVTGSTLRPMILQFRFSNSRLQAGHVTEFRGAHGRKILRVRKQDGPPVANPFVKVDRALRGFGREIGGRIIDP